MNVLFVGDIVGPEAARYLAERLPELRREHDSACRREPFAPEPYV